jgi:phosphoglycerate dehydrogenase-like enzyme
MTKIAVLDDWQDVARASADWTLLQARAEIVFFHRSFGSEDEAAAALADFDIVLTMRERTAFPASLIQRLPDLRMLGMTGSRAAAIDTEALTAQGVLVCTTGGEKSGVATAELALGLMLAVVRRIAAGDAAVRAGRFQEGVGMGPVLEGKTLGLIGLGRIGGRMARYGQALGMRVLAWSQNLSPERARDAGAEHAGKEALLEGSDVVSLHVVLSDRTRGVIAAPDLARMREGAVLVNTSRGPLIDEAALLEQLRAGRLFAGLDVYDQEPLPAEHPLRSAPNCVLSPHLGYCVQEVFAQFYRESVENALAFLDGKPVRVANPEALTRTA